MALQVTHGFLPVDGTSVDPSTFLENWINGSVILNLGFDNFGGGLANDLNFMISASDAPASNLRFPGLLWFKRGEGKLFMWDLIDQPSQITFGTQGDWISLTVRRDMWVRAATEMVPGQLGYLYPDSLTFHVITTFSGSNYPNEWKGDANFEGAGFFPFRQYWAVTGVPGVENSVGQLTDFFVVATETAASGAFFRACEWGFCDLLMHSGESGAAGTVIYASASGQSESAFGRVGQFTTSTDPGRMPIAFATDTSATVPAAEWLRPVFKTHMAPFGVARVR